MSYLKLLSDKIVTKFILKEKLNQPQYKNQKVVFTNGCFDILHQGHVTYLSKAKDLGDFLIVGLNSNSSVQLLNKSPERPINNETSRAIILAALACVDAVIIFEEQTPLQLITYLLPNILVKGKDYNPEQIVGYKEVTEAGGQVITIDLVDGFSTTKIIEKLKQ